MRLRGKKSKAAETIKDVTRTIRENKLKSRSSVSSWLFLVLLYSSSVLLVFLANKLQSEYVYQGGSSASAFNRTFADRSMEHIKQLSSIGVRMIGSDQNERLARDYLVRSLLEIRANANGSVLVEVATQRTSGRFDTDFLGGLKNVYSNVTNVLCRISPREGSKSRSHALLLNSHFDTSIGTRGAGDDLSQVGVMLALAELFVTGKQHMSHALILLFNGAEESNWLAAHGFISNNSPITYVTPGEEAGNFPNWADSVKAVVNLEAIGSGGRELLTRTTSKSSSLVEAYKLATAYPRGNVVADEIFRSKIFPGETDLSVFRDFGRIPGMDIIFVENGYGYHAAEDRLDRLEPHSLAREGEHLHRLCGHLLRTGHLASMQRLNGTELNKDDDVFFDFLGVYLFWYSADIAYFINIGVAALLLVWIFDKRGPLFLLRHVANAALRFVAPILASALSGAFMWSWSPLSWYSDPQHALVLFLPPSLAAALVVHSMSSSVSSSAMGGAAFLSIVQVAMTLLGIRSAYVIMLWTLPVAVVVYSIDVGSIFSRRMSRIRFLSSSDVNLVFLLLFAACCLAPVLYWFEVMRTVLAIFLPVMGRCGMILKPDLFISAIIGFFVSMLTLIPCSILGGLRSSPRQTRLLAPLLLLVSAYHAVLSKSKSSYSLERPKRLFVQHVERRSLNKASSSSSSSSSSFLDSGLWINGMDTLALEPLRQLGVKDWQEAKAYPCRGLACSLPWFFPLADELQDGWLLPAKPPPIEEARRMKLAVSEEERESQGKRVILSLDGPSHMGIIISDPHHRVTAWNLNLLSSDTGSNDVQTRRKQDMYFIYFASGLASASSQLHPWKLSIDLRSDARGRDDVGVAAFGHYLLFEGKDGTDLPGCSFSDEARGFAAILPEHLKPICFYNILYNFTL